MSKILKVQFLAALTGGVVLTATFLLITSNGSDCTLMSGLGTCTLLRGYPFKFMLLINGFSNNGYSIDVASTNTTLNIPKLLADFAIWTVVACLIVVSASVALKKLGIQGGKIRGQRE